MSDDQSIAEIAYHLWVARGRPHGSHEADWLEAERRHASAKDTGRGSASEEATDVSLKGTYPASDPAANQITDAPPSNAEEKWAAAGKPRTDKVAPARKPRVSKAKGKPAKPI